MLLKLKTKIYLNYSSCQPFFITDSSAMSKTLLLCPEPIHTDALHLTSSTVLWDKHLPFSASHFVSKFLSPLSPFDPLTPLSYLSLDSHAH